MSKTLIMPAALAIMLASGGGSFAQQAQYDRTGDHMMSYGPQATANPAPTPRAVRQREHTAINASAHTPMQVPIDRTGDHMLYYGPISR